MPLGSITVGLRIDASRLVPSARLQKVEIRGHVGCSKFLSVDPGANSNRLNISGLDTTALTCESLYKTLFGSSSYFCRVDVRLQLMSAGAFANSMTSGVAKRHASNRLIMLMNMSALLTSINVER